MDEFLLQLLKVNAIGSSRADENITRQGVMNHQVSAHLMDLAFVRDHTEMSIPESYAVQGLQQASASRDAMGLRTAIHVPSQDK